LIHEGCGTRGGHAQCRGGAGEDRGAGRIRGDRWSGWTWNRAGRECDSPESCVSRSSRQESRCSGKRAVVSTDIKKTDQFTAARGSASALSSGIERDVCSKGNPRQTPIVISGGANSPIGSPASGYKGILRDSDSIIGDIQRIDTV